MLSSSDRMSFKALLAASALAVAAGGVQAAATVVIVNGDPAGVGFNDTTPTAPVGGNPGTTKGQQRLIAFQAAANKWGATLTSTVTIRVLSTWEALTCTATGAVLGSAGATEIFRDFTGAPVAGHWYGKAQTAKLFGADPDPATADIRARFNINLGNAGCLTGIPFYLGIDNNHGTAVDLVAVLTHELGHGLGFQTFTNGSTGAFQSSFPSIWDKFLTDSVSGKTWDIMTPAERVASAISVDKLVWAGAGVTAAVPSVLGTPYASISGPAAGPAAGTYPVGPAQFGARLSTTAPVSGQVMPAIDPAGTAVTSLEGCNPYTAAMKLAVKNNIALVNRGTCGFTVKVKNAQDAGAIGVLIADNAAGAPAALGGSDPTITIPSVRITQAAGNAIRTQLAFRARSSSGVIGSMGLDGTKPLGADASNRALMYAPNPFQAGSSVSHFDVSAFPNLLMEPAINADLTHEVTLPFDLTYVLLLDIGW